jgi:hypothetical protein
MISLTKGLLFIIEIKDKLLQYLKRQDFINGELVNRTFKILYAEQSETLSRPKVFSFSLVQIIFIMSLSEF